MPRAPRPCTHPDGCRKPVEPTTARCADHQVEYTRRHENTRRRGRPSAAARGYNTAGHRTFRQAVLTRDPHCTCPRCPKCLSAPPCMRPSTDADHHPHTRTALIEAGKNPNDPRYGRGLCHQCHAHWTVKLHGGFGHDMGTPPGTVTIVCGPPCAGKTTWVNDQAQPGDLVLDVDALVRALTPTDAEHAHQPSVLPYALAARDAITSRLAHDDRRPTTWVITSLPPDDLHDMAATLVATVHPIIPTPDECIARLHADPAGRDVDAMTRVIKAWQGYA